MIPFELMICSIFSKTIPLFAAPVFETNLRLGYFITQKCQSQQQCVFYDKNNKHFLCGIY